MNAKLLLAVMAACLAATALAKDDRRPSAVVCPGRCLCAASFGVPVDCATCQCIGCPKPEMQETYPEPECSKERVNERPLYLSLATKACEKCEAANCDDEGCNGYGKCKKCARGFGRDLATGDCVQGTLADCLVVSRDNVNRCDKCQIGFARAYTGECVACTAPNAAFCRADMPAVPLACVEGFGLARDATTGALACQECDAALTGCAQCNGNLAKCTKCQRAKEGDTQFYVLTAAGTCAAFSM